MSTTCDETTVNLLRSAVGMRLAKVAARRYPGVLAYSQVIAIFAEGISIRIDLNDQTIAPMFEVFVARARPAEVPKEMNDWDQLSFGDFIVANVYVVRREEWLEKPETPSHQMHGNNGKEQKFGAFKDGNLKHEGVVVDSGLCFVSSQGAELILDADAFPLLLQFRYQVGFFELPSGKRCSVSNQVL